MARASMTDQHQIHELLLQALETERGGVQIYMAALKAAQNDSLAEEWQKYLQETQRHEEILTTLFNELGKDPEEMSPGREVVAHLGGSLVEAIEMALANGDSAGAELVAAECVVLAETKDHQNWELIGKVAGQLKGKEGKLLQQAYDEVEPEEDHHLYHTKGFARELWLQSLGLPAVLPPPEEQKHVETAIGAARAEKSREDLL